MLRRRNILFVVELLAAIGSATSLVTSGVGRSERLEGRTLDRRFGSSDGGLRLRIRKARRNDLDQVAELLSVSTADGYVTAARPTSLVHKMKLNRLRSAFRSELCARHEALEHFEHFGSGVEATVSAESMWGTDALFRAKLARAVEQSTSIDGGLKKLLSGSPPDGDLLYHAMIVAEDLSNGSVVGFCEIAMLPQPQEVEKHVPTFLNIVTSPTVRRRGVGGAIVRRATAYVSTYRRETAKVIALYVKDGNTAAEALYKKNGFSVVRKLAKGDERLLYMERQMC